MNKIDYEKLLKQVLKYYNKNKPTIPERVLDFNEDRIIKVLQRHYSQILQMLVNTLQYTGGDFSNISAITEMELMRQIEEKLSLMEAELQEEISDYINKQYVNGQLNHYIATTGNTDYNAVLNEFPFASINWYKAEQLIADTMDDLLFATNNTKKSIKRVIRETVGKHIQLNALQGESYKTIKRLIIKDLQKKGLSEKITKSGFVGVVDKSGRKWGLKNYTDMVVKTKTHQAYIEGIKAQCIETGKDLAVIPHKGATDPCKNFEGMIISMTGVNTNYPSYEQLKATNLIFHPRCKHNVIPIASAEALHEDDLKYHKEQLKNLKKISKKVKK